MERLGHSLDRARARVTGDGNTVPHEGQRSSPCRDAAQTVQKVADGLAMGDLSAADGGAKPNVRLSLILSLHAGPEYALSPIRRPI
jgi:hypothetical protein